MILRVLMLAALVLLNPFSGSAQVEELFKKLGLGKKAALSDEKITSGLKEALRVGTGNTVRSTGRVDGYFGNEAIKS